MTGWTPATEGMPTPDGDTNQCRNTRNIMDKQCKQGMLAISAGMLTTAGMLATEVMSTAADILWTSWKSDSCTDASN